MANAPLRADEHVGTTTPATGVAAHITVIDGQPTTTTQDIAEVFGKRHDNVMAIVRQRMADAGGAWCLLNFKETVTERKNPSGGESIKSPVIRMTEKGFMFVVQKFTGKKAVQTQIAYVDEFERMRAALAPSAPAIGYDRITPAQAQTLKELVQAVVNGGAQTHAETWARLHNKFRVNSYLALSAAQFDHACDYLRAKAASVNVHALPAPDSIDVRALLLSGQSEPVPLTPAQQALIDARAWAMAREAYELSRQHLARRVAYHCRPAHRADPASTEVANIVASTTLGNALAHEYHGQIRQLLNTARVFSDMAGNTFDALQALAAGQARQGSAINLSV